MGRNGQYFLTVLILLCIALACDGSGTNSTTTRTIGPGGGTITSADGRLTLRIPAGALDEDTEITIRRSGDDELPPEFDGFEGHTHYELGPDGLVFNIPIDVEIVSEQDAVDENGDITADFTILLTSLDGEIELLGDQKTIIDADQSSVIETGTLEHFSSLVKYEPLFTQGRIIGFSARIMNVPDKVALNTIFTIDARVSLITGLSEANSIEDFVATYRDNSLPDIIPADEISIEALINDDEGFFIAENSFDYLCNSTEETSGLFEAILRVSFTIQSNFDFRERTLVEKELIPSKRIECPTVVEQPQPTATPPPPTATPPPPTPELDIDEILANFELNCMSSQDRFQIFTNFGGSPFTIRITIDQNNENRGTFDTRGPSMTDVIITTPDDLFTLEGQLMDLEDGTFALMAEGSGFLGGMPPVDANITVKAEDWVFDLDGEGNVILREGDLRFNFPTLPLDNQSSVAECTGMKVE